MIFIVGEPSYERAPSFLIELVTFLFAIAFVTAVFGKDDVVFVKWKQAFADGNVLSTFSSLFAGAVFQTLFLKATISREGADRGSFC